MKNKTIKILLIILLLFLILGTNSFAATDINFDEYTYSDVTNFTLPDELKYSKYFCIIKSTRFYIYYTFDSTIDSFGLLEKNLRLWHNSSNCCSFRFK